MEQEFADPNWDAAQEDTQDDQQWQVRREMGGGEKGESRGSAARPQSQAPSFQFLAKAKKINGVCLWKKI